LNNPLISGYQETVPEVKTLNLQLAIGLGLGIPIVIVLSFLAGIWRTCGWIQSEKKAEMNADSFSD
jgi:hypothetical protein